MILPVHIDTETIRSADSWHGHASVGVAAAVVSSRSLKFKYGVLLYADANNTANIWIGRTGVTADANANTGGYPITPGASVILPFEELENLYAISTIAAQDLAWLGI